MKRLHLIMAMAAEIHAGRYYRRDPAKQPRSIVFNDRLSTLPAKQELKIVHRNDFPGCEPDSAVFAVNLASDY
jgi:hypothetical protein